MDNTTNIEENYRYVLTRMHHHGFPDSKNDELLEQMKQGVPRIFLEYHSAEYAGNVRANAHIEKAESGTYFPNRYQLELKRPESKFPRRQFFQIQNFKGHGRQYDIPWKMGVNLLRGAQALNNWLLEDGSSIREWRGLDFSQRTNFGYGYVSFDSQALAVAEKLYELPILEKNKEDLRHSAVIRSLEMGNTQSVHLEAPENQIISLRPNVPKRELDIIKNGHIISLEQLYAELGEGRDHNLQVGNAQLAEGSSGPDLLAAGKQIGKVLIVRPAAAETTATDKTMKVLTGNPITPHASNNGGNHVKHSI